MKLRVRVVGVGIGKRHIEGYRQHPHCEVMAVCAQPGTRPNPVAEEYAIPNRFHSFEYMLNKPSLTS